jgi:hypothetical protein
LQIEIHEKNRTLDEYRMRQEQEVLQLTQKHQMELMKKLQSAKEVYYTGYIYHAVKPTVSRTSVAYILHCIAFCH